MGISDVGIDAATDTPPVMAEMAAVEGAATSVAVPAAKGPVQTELAALAARASAIEGGTGHVSHILIRLIAQVAALTPPDA
jgi:hypothetical protein